MRHFVFALLLGFAVAQQPFTTLVPAGAILYFDLASCPTGWTELTTARGRYITGLVSGGTLNTGVGTALTDQENRTHLHTMAHTHTISGTLDAPAGDKAGENGVTAMPIATHTHAYSGPTDGSSAANTGNTSTMIAPYLQFPLCEKT